MPFLVLLGLACPIFADFPPRPAGAVADLAHVLSPEETERLETLARETRERHGIEVIVLTLKSLPPGESLEPYATRLFNHWGIGDRETNRGLLLLLPIAQRQIRIELGEGFGRGYDQAMQRVIQEDMVPLLKVERFGEGMHAGITAAVRVLSAPPPARQTPRAVTETPRAPPPPRDASPGGFSWTWKSIAATATAGLLSVWLFVRGFLRYRPRRCPKCLQQMERLSEAVDDEYLDESRVNEEMVKSVDYDVWLCRRCDEHLVARYTNWLSGYRDCPGCGARTLRTSQRVISHATTYSTGTREVTRSCFQCDYHRVTTEVIPMQTRSSSGSSRGGSSSGGGRSGGGGASGSW